MASRWATRCSPATPTIRSTVQTIVEPWRRGTACSGRVWIADRGMASAANLAWLRETGRRYIVGAPKAELRRFAAELAAPDGWRVDARRYRGQAGARSRHRRDGHPVPLGRTAQQRAGDARQVQPADRGGTRTPGQADRAGEEAARSGRGQPPDRPPAAAQPARRRPLRDRGCRPHASPAGLRLRVARSAAFDDWAALSEGAYVLRSNIADWSDEQLWKAYIQLTQAEAAFRIQKDQLRVRPIWHQREDRVQAHILVCFLAFVLWKCLEMWQSRAGLGNSPRTMLEELARIQSHDVVAAHRNPRRDPTALRHPARCRPGRAARSPWPGAAQTHAPRRAGTAGSLLERLNPVKNVVATFSLSPCFGRSAPSILRKLG